MNAEFLPAFLMAVLACWLGLSLLVRAPHDRNAQAFAWLCLHLTIYGLTAVLPALSQSPSARLVLEVTQVVETVFLPPVFLHFIMVLVSVGRVQRWRIWLLVLFYVTGGALAGYALSPGALVLGTAGALVFPPNLIAIWTVQRALPMLLALVLMFMSFREAAADDLEKRRRAMFALAAVIGVVGALWATLARNSAFSPALGHLLMDVALALLAYAVLAYRSLLPASVARRTFYRSLLGGLLTALYIGVLLLLEPLAARILQTNAQLPLITIFTLVVLIAVFGPLRDWAGSWMDRRFFHREFDYGRLLRAVGDDLLVRGDLAGQLQAALGAICRTLALRDGAVAVQEGAGLRVLASYGGAPDGVALTDVAVPETAQPHYGDWRPWPEARLLLPLRRGDETLGLLMLGMKRSGEPYRETERALLHSLGSYLALAIRHARSQQEEELAMAALAEQSRQLQAEQELLAAQASEAARLAAQPIPAAPADDRSGLRVFALGPLRVERDGVPIERWGGEKAGTYQAEALFAFLFDRRGRGLTKDEAEEVIWPDLELERADTAFHRTISALRRTLEPGIRRANESKLVAYHHERYWLDPAAATWCDADAFVAAAERGHTLLRQNDHEGARATFYEALELYRGDYMDDCPFFGDSSYVEARREELREQRLDALLALGAAYEQLGQAGEAATCYRRAISAADGECPRAEDALQRLQESSVRSR